AAGPARLSRRAQAKGGNASRLLEPMVERSALSGDQVEGNCPGGDESRFMSDYPGRYWHALDDGRIQCDLCPRDCRLHDGQRGLCFVRQNDGGRMVLTTYGRSSGFAVDPIEK